MSCSKSYDYIFWGGFFFLVACTRLYKPLCRSVRRSVGRSVGRSVRRSVRHTLLFFGEVAYRDACARLMAIGLVSLRFTYHSLLFFYQATIFFNDFTYASKELSKIQDIRLTSPMPFFLDFLISTSLLKSTDPKPTAIALSKPTIFLLHLTSKFS